MKDKIIDPQKDPLGAMMLDYLDGCTDAAVKVESDTLEMWEMTGKTMFRTFKEMNRIERKALGLCTGKILDIGAGSGCHSKYLQKKNLEATAIDISPGCVEVMRRTGIQKPMHTSFFSLGDDRFDTLLMLMNGIGICGSLEGLHLFLQFAGPLLNPGGQIIADSTDLQVLYPSPQPIPEDEPYYGETCFIMAYKSVTGDPFDWLYIDFDTLEHLARFHGFACERITRDRTGKYLARLFLD